MTPLSMTGVVFLITDVLFNEASAAAFAGGAAGLVIVLWYCVPLYWRLTDDGDGGGPRD